MKKILLVTTFIFGLASGAMFGQAYMETGKVGVSLNDYGRFRIYTPNTDGNLQLDRLSILISGDKTKLTDSTGVYDYQKDGESEVAADTVDSPALSDFEIAGQYNNAYSEAYPNFLVTANVYGWTNSSYVIVKFTVKNQEETAVDTKIGFEVIPMIDSVYGSELVKYDADHQVIDISYDSHVGIKFLNPAINALNIIDWYEDYYASDSTLWDLINFSSFMTDFTATGDGSVVIPSLANMNIAAGDSVEIYFAVAVDASAENVVAAITEAEDKFNTIGTEEEPNVTGPNGFKLAQNYPNPFNPSTQITFNLPQTQDVTLKVFNMLGQEVATLVKGQMSAGTHTVNFNAANLTSGLYIYKISAGVYTAAKKMMLVK